MIPNILVPHLNAKFCVISTGSKKLLEICGFSKELSRFFVGLKEKCIVTLIAKIHFIVDTENDLEKIIFLRTENHRFQFISHITTFILNN